METFSNAKGESRCQRYDIWCLLNDADAVAALSETPVDVLEREVVTFTEAAELQTTRRPPGGFSTWLQQLGFRLVPVGT